MSTRCLLASGMAESLLVFLLWHLLERDDLVASRAGTGVDHRLGDHQRWNAATKPKLKDTDNEEDPWAPIAPSASNSWIAASPAFSRFRNDATSYVLMVAQNPPGLLPVSQSTTNLRRSIVLVSNVTGWITPNLMPGILSTVATSSNWRTIPLLPIKTELSALIKALGWLVPNNNANILTTTKEAAARDFAKSVKASSAFKRLLTTIPLFSSLRPAHASTLPTNCLPSRAPPHPTKWCTINGIPVPPPHRGVLTEALHGLLQDPVNFVAGCVNSNTLPIWYKVLAYSPPPEAARIRRWVTKGVRVDDFMTPFNGLYRGQKYCSDIPSQGHAPSYAIPPEFLSCVEESTKKDIRSGARRLVCPVSDGFPESIHLVSPILIEPTKPRKCDDCTLLNCWMRPPSFTMEGLSSLTYWTAKCASVIDIASCFNNIPLHPESYKYFGTISIIDGIPYYFVATVLVFGCAFSQRSLFTYLRLLRRRFHL
ncbi:hypothetical protein BC829DRAFT_438584 [Chytridium lagenaria]|nr:hypothetical protein BC829DRAFT_438584 [Chytridium lagenaria]